jgi:hypothetical protein
MHYWIALIWYASCVANDHAWIHTQSGEAITNTMRPSVRPAMQGRRVVSIAAARRAEHHERHSASAWTPRPCTPPPAIPCSRAPRGLLVACAAHRARRASRLSEPAAARRGELQGDARSARGMATTLLESPAATKQAHHQEDDKDDHKKEEEELRDARRSGRNPAEPKERRDQRNDQKDHRPI